MSEKTICPSCNSKRKDQIITTFVIAVFALYADWLITFAPDPDSVTLAGIIALMSIVTSVVGVTATFLGFVRLIWRI